MEVSTQAPWSTFGNKPVPPKVAVVVVVVVVAPVGAKELVMATAVPGDPAETLSAT